MYAELKIETYEKTPGKIENAKKFSFERRFSTSENHYILPTSMAILSLILKHASEIGIGNSGPVIDFSFVTNSVEESIGYSDSRVPFPK